MNTNSTKMTFMNTMMIGIMVSMCSNSWMMIWAGLEISLMSFIPLMEKESVLSTESSIKYFIVQSISSSMMILGMIMSTKKISWLLISYSMMIKMGAAPFNTWMISVSEGLTYLNLFIMLSISKLPPMMIINYSMTENPMMSILSLITGAMMGLNQTSTRKILTYSSIYNLGFMLMMTKSTSNWISFLMIYSLMLLMTMMLMKTLSISYINQMSFSNQKTINKLSLWIMLMSMMGLPPSIGFINKLIIIELMIQKSQMVMITIMILTSLLTSFYYMRMTFSSFMFQSMSMKWQMKMNNKMLLSMSMMSMMLSPMMMTLKCIS
uniref:NADH dehydrogenase subunit 2 n=1 Tax=Xestocephalus limpidissimus TaxID=3112140 RepID=UPI002E76AE99|nr:NADH dehydrogenase subunit 2 [Xestocephalus limpidissimus]WRK21323.1 NADH dehydrogenase subunit 2 [Xestocephalus limpidissimus]